MKEESEILRCATQKEEVCQQTTKKQRELTFTDLTNVLDQELNVAKDLSDASRFFAGKLKPFGIEDEQRELLPQGGTVLQVLEYQIERLKSINAKNIATLQHIASFLEA